jgi:hypothetical protein
MELGRREYALNTDGLPEAEQHRLCGLLLEIVASDAGRVETDIPLRPEWPADVREAAERLLALPSSNLRKSYGQTGVIDLAEDPVWEDFVIVAPWAFDATVWSSTRGELVSLADESQSLVATLTDEQRATLGRKVPPGRIEREVRKGLRRRWEPDIDPETSTGLS